MGFNNSAVRRSPVADLDAAIIRHLQHGPMKAGEIALLVDRSSVTVYNRLYHLKQSGRVMGGKRSRNHGLWQINTAIAAPINPHVAPSRTAPDWRTTTLNYDLDAHRRLALLCR